jgi:hypothetical protein
MKLYIAVLDEVPDHMVPTLVAHTILNANEAFRFYPAYQEWLNTSFKKVVLRVNRKEFQKIAELGGDKVYLGYENTTLNAIYSCAIVLPGTEANVLKFAKMWKPKYEDNFPRY